MPCCLSACWSYHKPAAAAAGLYPVERRGFGASQGAGVEDRQQGAIAQSGWRRIQSSSTCRITFPVRGSACRSGRTCSRRMPASTRAKSGCALSNGKPAALCEGDGGEADIDCGQRCLGARSLGQVGCDTDRLSRQALAALGGAPPVEDAPLAGVGPLRALSSRLARVVAQCAHDVGREGRGACQARQGRSFKYYTYTEYVENSASGWSSRTGKPQAACDTRFST
jgi:hypothetical protein